MEKDQIDVFDIFKAQRTVLENVLDSLDKQRQLLYFGEKQIAEKEIDDRIINESMILAMKFNNSIQKCLQELYDIIEPIAEHDSSQD